MVFFIIILVLIVYLLPSIVAFFTRHPEFSQIALTNVLLGWSVLFWVVAFRHAIGLDSIEKKEEG